ncbi:DNA invertase (plasmid) [Microvirga ossetica]|uniref:DNA invertase n=1 Tax=Microvirga ossetica TaxID=1882682 RepID=A0A1B2EZT7_9HYPH|nr:recombinase family protein [Microvirga ossetica]ANY85505.1 DNA invertase [Microvirga ossetica]
MAATPPNPRLIGYARVSTDEQTTDPQVDELRAAGCLVVHQESASGASRSRPVLIQLLKRIEPGETLVVVRLDRLARSVSHLLEVVERLEAKGAHFRSLKDPIDTTTPQGMFSLQVLGAVAQLERSLIAERTKAGIAAARKRGRHPGNPGIRAGDPTAIRKAATAWRRAHLDKVIETADEWLPTVRRMRPHHRWKDVANVLRAKGGKDWDPDVLRKTVQRMVKEGLAEPELMERSPRRTDSERLVSLVAGIAMSDPDKTLREIASQLEKMRERTPRGGVKWGPSSVKSLLDRAASLGYEVPNRTLKDFLIESAGAAGDDDDKFLEDAIQQVRAMGPADR